MKTVLLFVCCFKLKYMQKFLVKGSDYLIGANDSNEDHPETSEILEEQVETYSEILENLPSIAKVNDRGEGLESTNSSDNILKEGKENPISTEVLENLLSLAEDTDIGEDLAEDMDIGEDQGSTNISENMTAEGLENPDIENAEDIKLTNSYENMTIKGLEIPESTELLQTLLSTAEETESGEDKGSENEETEETDMKKGKIFQNVNI